MTFPANILPRLPFPSYKWRWASVEPSEGLNVPPVYLGVLRAFEQFDGQPTSDPGLLAALTRVQSDTGTKINLARTGNRNLIRNSGQYWKVFNLLGNSPGIVTMTDFGRRVATGTITPTEFAGLVIKTLRLPSAVYSQQEIALWRQAGLSVKPLEMILSIIIELDKTGQGWMSNEELTSIVIPLVGVSATPAQCAISIVEYRARRLSLVGWPNCTPGDNDKRFAREYLLFLAHYGFLRQEGSGSRDTDRLILSDKPSVLALLGLTLRGNTTSNVATIADGIRNSDYPRLADRRRILTEVLARPQQAVFRKNVLAAFGSRCVLTGTSIPEVLEAAHIIPVKHKGKDSTDNGLCLRADLHQLFDSKHIRIDSNFAVHLSTKVQNDPVYANNLPAHVILPTNLVKALDWRWRYL